MINVEEDVRVARRYLSLCNRCSETDVEFSLTISDLRSLLRTKRCKYTGVAMSFEEGDNQLTIDKIDPSKGYVKGNVLAVCRSINRKKGCLSPTEIAAIHKYAGG